MVTATRSGGTPIKPDPVKDAIEAAAAEPGQMSEARASRRDPTAIDPGSTTVEAMQEQEEEETKKPDLEIQLLDADDKPVKNEKLKLILKDGSKKDATTDDNGVVTEKEVEGAVGVHLVDRYDYEWNFVKTEKLGGDGS